MKNHEGPHSAEHPYPDCFGCRVKGGFQVAPSSMPSRHNKVLPRRADPAWERGRVGEHRSDGSFMPVLNAEGTPMGVKEAQNRRSQVDEGLRRLRNDPDVFRQKVS